MYLIKTRDKDATFFTECFKQSKVAWEHYYLQQLAKGIIELVKEDLLSAEDNLFQLFLQQDEDMDQRIDIEETGAILRALGVKDPMVAKSLVQNMYFDDDQCLEFVELLRWFNAEQANTTRPSPFSFTSGLGFLNTGQNAFFERLKGSSDRESLKACIIGYRGCLRDVRYYKATMALKYLSDDAVEEIDVLHQLLLAEIDCSGLFEMFCEIDSDHTGELTYAQQKELFKLLDPDVSDAEMDIYLKEVNSEKSLNFVNFYDWWEQSKRIATSLVSRKGGKLQTRSMATAVDRFLGSFGLVKSRRDVWNQMEIETQMRTCEYYKALFLDIRHYKMENRIAELEASISGVLKW